MSKASIPTGATSDVGKRVAAWSDIPYLDTKDFRKPHKPITRADVLAYVSNPLKHILYAAEYIWDTLKPARQRSAFKYAVIHPPKDDVATAKILKNIASFQCSAAVRYMDTLGMDDDRKSAVIDGLLQDLKQGAI